MSILLQNTLVVGVAILLLSSYLEIWIWSSRTGQHDKLCLHGKESRSLGKGAFCLKGPITSPLFPPSFASASAVASASASSSVDIGAKLGPGGGEPSPAPGAKDEAVSAALAGNMFSIVQSTFKGVSTNTLKQLKTFAGHHSLKKSELNGEEEEDHSEAEKKDPRTPEPPTPKNTPCHSLMRRRRKQPNDQQHLKPHFRPKTSIQDMMQALRAAVEKATREKLSLQIAQGKHSSKPHNGAASAKVGGEPSEPQTLGTFIDFATNSVDKLKYQVDNFEPLKHKFSDPQWNDIPLKTKGVLLSREHDKKGPNQVANSNRRPILRKKSFLVGISSVNRKQNYLLGTLKSFFQELDEEERLDVKIIVFNGDVPASKHADISRVQDKFSDQIDSDQLEIIDRGTTLHEPLTHPERLTLRWGDKLDRVKWRSKQALDVAYLMNYAAKHHNGYRYFLMMEDDIKAAKHWAKRCRNWMDSHLSKRTDWTIASFYNPWENVKNLQKMEPFKFFGVIGQVFRLHDLPVVVEFLQKNFDQSPLDWLFVDFLKKFNGTILVSVPSLFQHEGTVSSLAGKTQSGRSVDFAYEPTYRVM